MKRASLVILTGCALTMTLTACSRPGNTVTWNGGNPLVTSRYGDDLADTMAALIISKDPAAEDPAIRPTIDRAIAEGKRIGADARSTMERGMQGGLIPIQESLTGYAVYVDDRLYLSSDFETKPGPTLHVFLTAAVDPRDASFPDATAVDLGLLQSPYGPQQYDVPPQPKADMLRTVVFWDTSLRRLYGFGQLSKR